MPGATDDLSERLAQLHLTQNAELSALHARHHRERAALLTSSPPIPSVTVHSSSSSLPVAVPVSPSAAVHPPASDFVHHPLSIGNLVGVLNTRRIGSHGDRATIVRFTPRKANWVCIRLNDSGFITWRSGVNLEFLASNVDF